MGEFDAQNACGARVHGYLLGLGKDAYPADRAVAGRITEDPLARGYRTAVGEAREFLLRAVRCLVADHGVSLVVELGCGMPCEPNVHQVAREVRADTRTVYVDHDDLVVTHGRAVLADHRTRIVHADLTDIPTLRDLLERLTAGAGPVAVCLSSVLEFLPDPAAVLDTVAVAVPAGSWLVVSHITDDDTVPAARAAARLLGDAQIRMRPRFPGEIAGLLSGYRMLAPGLVPPHHWPDLRAPDGPRRAVDGRRWRGARLRLVPTSDDDVCCLAGVGQVRTGDSC
ncbi:SAM-dependent methyltransferase [Nocardia sp. alder85J]|uniref:SAM-dependent methyltransferase n=1 Tax=Nocardia sp. alder85J TaxID=2862949 RepID=UPI001CD35F88|nr:SAM-dependent methyltransferase [Nocardia sp. alder85J]MCX4097745.1 SAM-dependent methyltransferase [Nocardia sp. alder85J]